MRMIATAHQLMKSNWENKAMSKAIKWQYITCTQCLHLLTDLYFNNSTVCDICTNKNKGE